MAAAMGICLTLLQCEQLRLSDFYQQLLGRLIICALNKHRGPESTEFKAVSAAKYRKNHIYSTVI